MDLGKDRDLNEFIRIFNLKCNNPKCKSCNPEIKKMSGINHRLFSNNRSTATHWYPGKPESGRKPILISDLTPDHLAAIVDQYEGEAVKFLEENIREAPKVLTEQSKRNSPITQRFLAKNVAAWPAIKDAQYRIQRRYPERYNTLFVEKKYNVRVPKPAPVNPFLNSFFDLSFLKNKGIAIDIETPMPKVEYKPNATYSVSQTERERIKQRIALKLTEMRICAKDIEKSTNRMKEVSMEIEKLMTQL